MSGGLTGNSKIQEVEENEEGERRRATPRKERERVQGEEEEGATNLHVPGNISTTLHQRSEENCFNDS